MRVCSVVVFISRLVVPLKFDWDFSSNRSCFCCGFYFIPTDKISCQAADRPWRWFPWWQASPVDLALMAQLKLVQKRRILGLPPLFVIRFGNLTNVSFYRCHQEFVTNSMQACNSIAHCIPVKGIKSRLISYFYSRFYPKIVKKNSLFNIVEATKSRLDWQQTINPYRATKSFNHPSLFPSVRSSKKKVFIGDHFSHAERKVFSFYSFSINELHRDSLVSTRGCVFTIEKSRLYNRKGSYITRWPRRTSPLLFFFSILNGFVSECQGI